MRIFLIGPSWDTGRWTEYCADGLKSNGHAVAMYRYSHGLARPLGLKARLRRRLLGADQFHLERVFDQLARDNLGVLKAAIHHRPELTIVLKGEVLLPETIDRLGRVTDGPIVQWSGDDPTWFPHIVAAAHLYDRFFLADPSYGNDLKRHGVTAAFLPHAADLATWREPGVANEPADVVFVGDARHNMGHLPIDRSRVDIVETVARTDVNLAIWGRGWEKLESTYRARAAHRGLTLLPAAAVATVYRSAKIVLNVHHAQMHEGPNMRTFEIPAAGAFQLTDYKTRMDELFNLPTELAVYHDSNDLLDSMQRFLHDSEARREITEASRKRVERDHTYAIRMQQLVEATFGG